MVRFIACLDSLVSNVSSGFKYPIMRISCSRGLLSNFSLHRTGDNKSIVQSDSGGRHRRDSTTFFIGPYVDKYEARKERLRAHHKDIIKVFEKWLEVTVSPTNQKEGLYTTSFPMYLEVVKKIRADDKFCEGLSHLESKEYMNPWKLYKQMEGLEDSHNQKVSDFMETEEKIRTSIANDNEILPEERKGFNLGVVYSINLSQAPEPTQDFYKFVQQTHFGYDLSSIFEHLVKKSMKSDDSELDVGTFETGLGYLLPKLTSRYTDKIIALSILSTRERIIKLKHFINSVPPDTINKLGEFNGNIENIRNLLINPPESV